MTATLPRVEGRIEIIYTSDTPAGNTKVITFTDKIRCTMEGMGEAVEERRGGGGEVRRGGAGSLGAPLQNQPLSTYSSTVKQPRRHADPSRRGVRHHGVGGATQDGRGHTGGGGGEEGVNGSASARQDGRGHLIRPTFPLPTETPTTDEAPPPPTTTTTTRSGSAHSPRARSIVAARPGRWAGLSSLAADPRSCF